MANRYRAMRVVAAVLDSSESKREAKEEAKGVGLVG
jgi:hypothetical protein